MTQAERAELVARVVFAHRWDQLAHTSRVVQNLRMSKAPDEVIATAWLHDVIEDTDLTAGDLLDLDFDSDVVDAVVLLTRFVHDQEEEYSTYIGRIMLRGPMVVNPERHRIARRVKLSDAQDNLRRCQAATGVPRWERLARERYLPLIDLLHPIVQKEWL